MPALKGELMVLLLALGAVLGEPAFRRQQAQQAQQAPQQEQAAEEAGDAPYAPSGWKPAGQRLELPPRQYGAPAPGAPKEEELDATTEPPTEEPPAEPQQPSPKPGAARSGKQQEQVAVQQGEYYVILPDGRLQRVQFAAKLEASPRAREEGQDGADDADAEEPAPAPSPAPTPAPAPRAARPKAANRPVPRPQPAPAAAPAPQAAQQQQQAVVPAVPVAQADYFVVLPDGRLQEVQYFGRLEAAPAGKQDADDDAPAPSPSARPAAPRRPASKPAASRARPQTQRQQVQQQAPVVLQQQDVPSSFVAELRFMEVPPIAGPVYSYSQPLVRVQREL